MSKDSCPPLCRKQWYMFIPCVWIGFNQMMQTLRNWLWGFGQEYTRHQQISQFIHTLWGLCRNVAGLPCPRRTQLASPSWQWSSVPAIHARLWGTRSLHRGSVTPAGRQHLHGGRRRGEQESKRTKAKNRWRGPFWLSSSHLEGMTRRTSVLHTRRRGIDRHPSRKAKDSL